MGTTIGRGTGNRPYDVYDKAETVSKAGVETITGQKTFTAPLKVADAVNADEATSLGQINMTNTNGVIKNLTGTKLTDVYYFAYNNGSQQFTTSANVALLNGVETLYNSGDFIAQNNNSEIKFLQKGHYKISINHIEYPDTVPYAISNTIKINSTFVFDIYTQNFKANANNVVCIDCIVEVNAGDIVTYFCNTYNSGGIITISKFGISISKI